MGKQQPTLRKFTLLRVFMVLLLCSRTLLIAPVGSLTLDPPIENSVLQALNIYISTGEGPGIEVSGFINLEQLHCIDNKNAQDQSEIVIAATEGSSTAVYDMKTNFDNLNQILGMKFSDITTEETFNSYKCLAMTYFTKTEKFLLGCTKQGEQGVFILESNTVSETGPTLVNQTDSIWRLVSNIESVPYEFYGIQSLTKVHDANGGGESDKFAFVDPVDSIVAFCGNKQSGT